MTSETPTSRRRVLAVGGLGVGAAALSACGGNDEYRGSNLTESPSTPESAPQGAALVDLGQVPIGGAVSAKGPDGKPVVVARPAENEVTAHSAVCTHMGCTVKPSGDVLTCPCHGSVFRAASGEVVTGPADRPLPDIPVRIAGGKVVTGGN